MSIFWRAISAVGKTWCFGNHSVLLEALSCGDVKDCPFFSGASRSTKAIQAVWYGAVVEAMME
jgi:hypothetical protein